MGSDLWADIISRDRSSLARCQYAIPVRLKPQGERDTVNSMRDRERYKVLMATMSRDRWMAKDLRLQPQRRVRLIDRRLGWSLAGGRAGRPLPYGSCPHLMAATAVINPRMAAERPAIPSLAFESLVDEGGGERAGSRTPNTTTRPRI
jgi:hypothetical protein